MHKLPNDFNEGSLLLFNKPSTWTSFDVVNKVRNETRAKKVGHAGTLDPLATGLLVICTGPYTKQIDQYQAEEKEYTGTIVLGATTASFDLETSAENHQDYSFVNEALLRETAKKFLGSISQTPPIHSAKKIAGERAYQIARRGEQVEIKSVQVDIREFELTKIELPKIFFRVVCSKGTYIRSLANDFGAALGCGAYLADLCRTRSGNFRLEEAWELADFVALMKQRRAENEFK